MKRNSLLLILTCVFAQFASAQLPVIWGTTTSGGSFGEGTIFNMNLDGSNFTVAHNFTWPAGFVPMGNLFQASDGNLYGVCMEGGDSGSCTLYEYKPSTGDYNDVYDFGSLWGDFPTSGVVEKDGILYGNSSAGGSFGGGVIFSYNISSGVYSDVYNLPWGSYPQSAPTFANNGILYGVTVTGGVNGSGSIYSFNPSTNAFTDVHDFSGQTGFNPYPGLLSASNGKLYGMTTYGGTYGKGIIFSLDPSDNTYEKLYDFDNDNGGRPKGALTEGFDGALYGTTTIGGTNGDGIIFKFDLSDNSISKLYDFTTSDGSVPLGNLNEVNHSLCGTTSSGGANGFGTAFVFDMQNYTFTKLIDFDGTNGSSPNCGLITLSDEVATGIPASVDDHLAVYPNPVSSFAIFTLSSLGNNSVTVKVNDVNGKEILSQNLQAKNSEVEIDLSKLTAGVYFIEVITGNEKRTAKLLKD